MRSVAITCSNTIYFRNGRFFCCFIAGLIGLFLLNGISNARAATEPGFQTGVKAYLKGDYTAAFGLWQPLAQSGDAPAQFNLGVLYAQGLGVKKDPAMAAKWYQRSATAGYTPAQFNLGEAYFSGTGVRVDTKKAVHWWTTAATHHHIKAQYNLGYLYLSGNGVTKDRKQAIFWFQQAASQSDPYAIKMLNSMSIKPARTSVVDAQPIAGLAASKSVVAKSKGTSSPAKKGTVTRKRKKSAVSANNVSTAPKKIKSQTIPIRVGKKKSKSVVSRKQHKARPVVGKMSVKQAEIIPGVKNAAWLGQQRPKYYTVQLLADRSSPKVLAFYRRYRWDRTIGVFETTKNGKNWFKMVYGIFKNGRWRGKS